MYFVVPKWIYGRPVDFWLRYRKQIKDFVIKEKPDLLSAEELGPRLSAEEAMGARSLAHPQPPVEYTLPPWIWKYGGRRIAHLHLGDDIYLLSDEQWDKFTGAIKKDLQARLARINTVSFDQAMEISHALEGAVPDMR